MSVNKFSLHVLILPEDDANRQIANGFVLALSPLGGRQVQVLPVAGGWREVLRQFSEEHVRPMEKWNERRLILVLDFDGDDQRRETVEKTIPPQIKDRVFVLGTLTEPEDLKRDGLGSYEQIGIRLCTECERASDGIWHHRLLSHNAQELKQLREDIRPILFPE